MRLFTVFFALLLVILPSAAQSDPDTRPALLHVLSAAPDTPQIRDAGIIASFVDYQAALALRGIDVPASFADIQNLNPDAQTALLWALPAAGPQSLSRSFMLLGDMPDVMGFDFFDITQAAEIGAPPANAVILSGEFDSQAMIDAHLARGYTEQPDDFGVMLCGADGCESGDKSDFANRLESNPFGGNLGQSQPLTVNDSSISLTRVRCLC